jgi:5-methylcytosine-specific restriction enzyme B
MLSGNLLIHDLGLQPADKPDDGSAFSCRSLERCKRSLTCTNNLEAISAKASGGIGTDLRQLVLLCVLTFPPSDEIYFAITVRNDVKRLIDGLIKLYRDVELRNQRLIAKGKRPGRINNNVKFFLTKGGWLYFSNEFVEELRPENLDPTQFVDVDTVSFSIWPPTEAARHGVFAREFVGYIGSLVGRDKVHEFVVWKDATGS